MAFTMIKDITPLKESWRLKVRIVRFWEQLDFKDHTVIGTHELILVDEKGSKIQATINKHLFDNYKNLVKEGATRIISNFLVKKTGGQHRATSHDYKIVFFYKTNVRECENVQLSLHGFDFVPFDKMLKKEVNDVFLVDVIGECTAMSDKIDTSTNGTPNYKQKYNKWYCMGKYAEQMSEYKKEGIQGRPIIILQFAKIKIWRGNTIHIKLLCNSLFATKIFINEDISEVNDYKER
ncbi:uncharacterized protein [Spinacia oleracea]|uniref:Replication protein A 70 kDa DNA-binding subunit B/D first OB fold domain-containing protein n=1 Tax=Spinacia oleracea TaxID=3562 RepID=A0ABM3RID5_SPIOL|nr:uncharacterized protein LOC130469885 [Spinacia oleracea]